jgi:drug/metabolite transporter (DMT)-like permease
MQPLAELCRLDDHAFVHAVARDRIAELALDAGSQQWVHGFDERIRRAFYGMMAAMDRKPLDTNALGLMVVLTMLWGLQQVAIKLALAGVSPIAQAAIRSIVATLLLLAWARWRQIPLFDRDGTLSAGIAAGLLFAGEFFLIYVGLNHTAASRMVVFVYLAPILTALGLVWLVPGEHLSRVQWVGVLLAFAGLVLAFADGFTAPGRSTVLGDACGAAAAVLWASTTVLIRATRLAPARAEKTLFYQLAVSAVALAIASPAIGEPGVMRIDATLLASLVFQSVVVAFASYLAWFWLLTKYLAARLSVFSFLAPLFGVAFGVLLLGESLTGKFVLAALAVGAGIALVNLRRR